MNRLWIDPGAIPPPEGWDHATTADHALTAIRTRLYTEVDLSLDLPEINRILVDLEDGARHGFYTSPIRWNLHSCTESNSKILKEVTGCLERCNIHWEAERVYRETGKKLKLK